MHPPLTTARIREKYLQFFAARGHAIVPAVPVVNKEDPSLFFVNAGMNPFKDVFLGGRPVTKVAGTPLASTDAMASPIPSRVADSQHCLRVSGKHNDLEDVGWDGYHLTLFEMLGNWSFGDYFKEEAIAWAWELLTEVYQLPKDQLYATVFAGDEEEGLARDEESFQLWKAWLPEERILFASKKDNFWEMGAQGPCGPCTEIHVDIRPAAERAATPGGELVNASHPLVIEIWNLVFMQYNRQASGQLVPLPARHVDTGMGLERLAMVLQGQQTIYETDGFVSLIEQTQRLAGLSQAALPMQQVALRVVADHIRAIAFAIADGQRPSNNQAGYVVRRLLRRAVRYGYQHLGLREPFLYALLPTLVVQMGEAYPQLRQQQTMLAALIREEEEQFLATLSHGLKHFLHHAAALRKGDTLAGETAFQLYDTYGFPADLTQVMAREEGLQVDMAGFEAAMQQQRERSRQAAEVHHGDWQVVHPGEETTFVGYETLTSDCRLLRYRVQERQGETLYQLILDRTPFYPQGGGQVGDKGWLHSSAGAAEVVDTVRENNLIIHYATSLPAAGQGCLRAEVDAGKRQGAACHHTATHLLVGALQQVLGKEIIQQGSYLDHEYLRFDFSHGAPLSAQEIAAIEQMVNEKIRANIPRGEQRACTLEEALAQGAMTLPGEKYDAKVRVIAFDPAFSIALCGGTHVAATGELGFFKIVSERGLAAGIRRLRAVAGTAAEAWVHTQQELLAALREACRQPDDLLASVQALRETCRQQQTELTHLKRRQAKMQQAQLMTSIQQKPWGRMLVAEVEADNPGELRKLATSLSKSDIDMLVLGARCGAKAALCVMVSGKLSGEMQADTLLSQLLPSISGKGGGNAGCALGTGDHLAGLADALGLAERHMDERHATACP